MKIKAQSQWPETSTWEISAAFVTTWMTYEEHLGEFTPQSGDLSWAGGAAEEGFTEDLRLEGPHVTYFEDMFSRNLCFAVCRNSRVMKSSIDYDITAPPGCAALLLLELAQHIASETSLPCSLSIKASASAGCNKGCCARGCKQRANHVIIYQRQ